MRTRNQKSINFSVIANHRLFPHFSPLSGAGPGLYLANTASHLHLYHSQHQHQHACSTAAQDTRTLSTGGQLFILLSPLSTLIIIYMGLTTNDEIVGCSPVWLLGKVAPLPITAAPRCTMRCTSASFNCSDPSPDSGLELEHWNTIPAVLPQLGPGSRPRCPHHHHHHTSTPKLLSQCLESADQFLG